MRRQGSWILVFITVVLGIVAAPYEGEKTQAHEKTTEVTGDGWFAHETGNSYWYEEAQKVLTKKLRRTLNTGIAKNVIFFLGDGMSIPTLTAARIYQEQLNNQPGEEGSLYFENFPYTGLVKTWCIDSQVPDSACTSTAYLGGVKTKRGTLGLNGNVVLANCETQIEENHVNSIAKWAQDHGKGAGIVTTTRVTHASPGGSYAHSADRQWESDTNVIRGGYDPKECHDIATQLVKSNPGKEFKVILGGGRQNLLPNDTIDDEGHKGVRSDGINLIEEWKKDKTERNSKHAYIWNKTDLYDVIEHPENYDHVLGLFESSHFPYHLDNSAVKNPTLAEMTEAAIKLLQKEQNGFFLFIEGGHIDMAHHINAATLALDETVEMAKAVEKATAMTSESDTLIVVTADHSHGMSISGYPKRGSPINGVAGTSKVDNRPYATLMYGTGPGYRTETDGNRYDPTEGNYSDVYYKSPALVPAKYAYHGGDDVAIFARGPWAHLFTGSIMQSNIPHFLGYASCLGKSKPESCNQAPLSP